MWGVFTVSAHRGRVRTKFPRKLRLNSGRLLGQPRSALDSVTTKYETIFPCNPEHQVPELMPINIPLHNIGQARPEQRLPNIQCPTWLCVTLYIYKYRRFRKVQLATQGPAIISGPVLPWWELSVGQIFQLWMILVLSQTLSIIHFEITQRKIGSRSRGKFKIK